MISASGTILLIKSDYTNQFVDIVVKSDKTISSCKYTIYDSLNTVVAEGQAAADSNFLTVKIDVVPILWTPNNPNLFRAEAEILFSDGGNESIASKFAFRMLSADTNGIYLNGDKFYFRGYIRGAAAHEHGNNANLSLRDYYRKNIIQAKRFGFNLIRFHSEIPHDECFEVADELGIFIHIELRKASDNYENIEEMLYGKKVLISDSEIERICNRLYNHPSFAVYCIGNELRNPGNNKRIHEIGKLIKKIDGMRLFIDTCAHGEFDRNGVDFDVQHMSYFFPVGIHADMYENTDNLLCFGSVDGKELSVVSPQVTIKRKLRYRRPVLAHEICHYSALRDFKNLKEKFLKYNTPAPWWIDEELKMIDAKGFSDIYDEMYKASKYFQYTSWKLALESLRSSRLLSGFHMLQFADTDRYENSNGVVDCFDDEQFTKAEDFIKFNGDYVLIAKLEERVFYGGQKIKIPVFLSKYGEGESFDFHFSLYNKDELITKSVILNLDAADNGLHEIAGINLELPSCHSAAKLKLECSLTFNGNEVTRNDWNIWVYPENANNKVSLKCDMREKYLNKAFSYSSVSNTVITDKLDDSLFDMLENGKDVVLIYRQDWTRHIIKKDISAPKYSFRHSWDRFKPVVWDRGTNFGGLIEQELLNNYGFATDRYIDLQYLSLIDDCDKINLDDFPVKVKSLICGIDKNVRDRFDVHKNYFGLSELQYDRTMRNFSYLFELRVGKGKLLVCGLNLTAASENNPAAVTMLKTLCDYAASKEFNPSAYIETSKLKSYLSGVAGEGPQKERIMTQFWQLDNEPVESMKFWKESREYLTDSDSLPGCAQKKKSTAKKTKEQSRLFIEDSKKQCQQKQLNVL